MKIVIALALATIAVALPQREGGVYTNEAIRQAKDSQLLPSDALIQKVDEGIEIGAYENIPGNQRINLAHLLGDQVPPEVISNLQSQVDGIGRH